ncbi:hypothetical protein BDB01DRAFT_838241 [Pilobolus umbonatus]|nr:hypothetical protein BDB01DRAFT_838241 [Pilobolus umbonatus]
MEISDYSLILKIINKATIESYYSMCAEVYFQEHRFIDKEKVHRTLLTRCHHGLHSKYIIEMSLVGNLDNHAVIGCKPFYKEHDSFGMANYNISLDMTTDDDQYLSNSLQRLCLYISITSMYQNWQKLGSSTKSGRIDCLQRSCEDWWNVKDYSQHFLMTTMWVFNGFCNVYKL